MSEKCSCKVHIISNIREGEETILGNMDINNLDNKEKIAMNRLKECAASRALDFTKHTEPKKEEQTTDSRVQGGHTDENSELLLDYAIEYLNHLVKNTVPRDLIEKQLPVASTANNLLQEEMYSNACDSDKPKQSKWIDKENNAPGDI